MPLYGSAYCVETPAHPSYTSVCPGGFSYNPVEDIKDRAGSEISYVNQLLGDITSLADTTGDAAVALIQQLAAYQAPTLPQVTYTAPAWTDPPIQLMSPDEFTYVEAPTTENRVVWVQPSFNEVAEPSTSITAPTGTLPAVPAAPDADSLPAVPAAPGGYTPVFNPTPTLTLPEQNVEDVDAPTLAEISLQLPDPVTVDPLSLSLDYSWLDTALNQLQNISVPSDEIPAYAQLYDDVFTVVGSMVSGQGIDTDLVLLDTAQARSVAKALSRRGLSVPDAVFTFDAWVQEQVGGYAEDSATLFSHTYTNNVVTASLKLATRAEKILYDAEVGVADAQFKHAIAQAQASGTLAKALGAYYDGLVAELEGRAAEYNAELAQVRANTEAAVSAAALAETAGDANKTISRAFAAEERSKAVDGKLFGSLVSSEAAKLEAMRAEVIELEAFLADAQAGFAEYSGTVAAYLGEVARVKGVFKQYRAHASATTETNQATIAQTRGQTAELKGQATAARAAAARAAVESSRMVRNYESQRANHSAGIAQNDIASLGIAKVIEAFSISSAEARIEALHSGIHPHAVASIGQAVSRFTNTALDSAGRAASLAQSANEALAKAYAAAYEVAGKAGAMVQSGRLSSFRASATLSASANLDATESTSETYSSSGSLDYSDSDIATESIST